MRLKRRKIEKLMVESCQMVEINETNKWKGNEIKKGLKCEKFHAHVPDYMNGNKFYHQKTLF